MLNPTMPRALLLACAACLAACESQEPVAGAETEGPPTLARLCTQHPTDKCPATHNYVEIYEMLFGPMRSKTTRVLEIGVEEGHSLRLWEAYFPAARIFGIDIVDSTRNDAGRVKTLVADQGKREDLARVIAAAGGSFDIVVDDGGHRMDQQQISFATLFPAVKSGGLYVIEDIHTSFPELYPDHGVDPDGQNSTYALIDRFNRTERIESQYLTAEESRYLTANISRCAYFLRLNGYHSDLFAC
jgi:hypothetical protein